MLSSPGCWKLYGEILANEILDPRNFGKHKKLLLRWGESVWTVWKAKHGKKIISLANQINLD
jgi:hypothetical protein